MDVYIGDTSNTAKRLPPLQCTTYWYRALSSLTSSEQSFQALLDHYLLEKESGYNFMFVIQMLIGRFGSRNNFNFAVFGSPTSSMVVKATKTHSHILCSVDSQIDAWCLNKGSCILGSVWLVACRLCQCYVVHYPAKHTWLPSNFLFLPACYTYP